LTGKHRQFFDVGAMNNGTPLRRVGNFLDTYLSAYALHPSDLNALFGAHAAGLPFVLSHGLWAKYELGKRYTVVDPGTGAPAVRNPFLEPSADGRPILASASIVSLGGRGARFLACNNSIRSLASDLAGGDAKRAATISTELTEGVIPGAFIVPAMLIAGNRAQESGCTYALLA
jgi:hypothetical protein